ncbi:MAG: hypothetical protein RQ862_08955 [Candidatus Caldarchaeales archaeon]|nr:hypothetical protein [Candidatus Caldarchaeales archaeon]
MEKEIGVVKKEKSKLRHILGIEHGNIPIQLDLWGNEVIFRGKDKQHYTDIQDQKRILKSWACREVLCSRDIT